VTRIRIFAHRPLPVHIFPKNFFQLNIIPGFGIAGLCFFQFFGASIKAKVPEVFPERDGCFQTGVFSSCLTCRHTMGVLLIRKKHKFPWFGTFFISSLVKEGDFCNLPASRGASLSFP